MSISFSDQPFTVTSTYTDSMTGTHVDTVLSLVGPGTATGSFAGPGGPVGVSLDLQQVSADTIRISLDPSPFRVDCSTAELADYGSVSRSLRLAMTGAFVIEGAGPGAEIEGFRRGGGISRLLNVSGDSPSWEERASFSASYGYSDVLGLRASQESYKRINDVGAVVESGSGSGLFRQPAAASTGTFSLTMSMMVSASVSGGGAHPETTWASIDYLDVELQVVPEPASGTLLLGLSALRSRRKRARG